MADFSRIGVAALSGTDERLVTDIRCEHVAMTVEDVLSDLPAQPGATLAAFRSLGVEGESGERFQAMWVLDEPNDWSDERLDELCGLVWDAGAIAGDEPITCVFVGHGEAEQMLDSEAGRLTWYRLRWPTPAAG